ncbi:MAG: hypothetical protein FD138_2586 [Planctomycetota bacterium]|nr:MAG: hypothetical protein FD138_2586 [Planctomycetota bacterium]
MEAVGSADGIPTGATVRLGRSAAAVCGPASVWSAPRIARNGGMETELAARLDGVRRVTQRAAGSRSAPASTVGLATAADGDLVEFRERVARFQRATRRVDDQHLFLVSRVEARCGVLRVARANVDRGTARSRADQCVSVVVALEMVARARSSAWRVAGGRRIVLAANSASRLDRRDRVTRRTDPRAGTAGVGTSPGRVDVERRIHWACLAAVRRARVRGLTANQKRQRRRFKTRPDRTIRCHLCAFALAGASGWFAGLRLFVADHRTLPNVSA